MTFEEASREWHALLRDVGESFVALHLDAAFRLAVALYCQDESDAEAATESVAKADQRGLLALSGVLRRLIEVAVRDHSTFLLPSVGPRTSAIESSTHKTQTARQTAQIQSLPDAFQVKFRQLLEQNWSKLTDASSTTFSLPRVQQLDWKVAEGGDAIASKRILVRLQTSDGKTRTIHVPVKQFHQLRYSAATVLQEMNQVEAHPMMRLAYMERTNRPEVTATTNVP